ncbi:hypothetical protein STENM223S_07444 [Streptomyces tendae]
MLAAEGRVFAELLEHWGLERPLVAAHDFGGAVALRAHLLHGVPYGALALVDQVALAPWGSPFFRLVGDHAEVFAQLPGALHGALVREYVGSTGGPGLHPAVVDRLVEPWLGASGQPAFYRQMAQADQRYADEVRAGTPVSTSPRSSAGVRTMPGFPWPRGVNSPVWSPVPGGSRSPVRAIWSRRTRPPS